MAKTYVTFGFDHVHTINGKTFDKDCVAVIECSSSEDGRNKAFEYFGDRFCFEYHEKYFKMESLKYFRNGLVAVN
jgi:hypothetical protein